MRRTRYCPTHRPGHCPYSGFTLIEILVAIVVLSIGLLGAVGMQLAALQANKEARHQAVGVRYAQELAEKMRANRQALADAAYAIDWKSTEGPADFTTDCARRLCGTASEVAHWDLYDLTSRLLQDEGLPKARLVVCRDAHPYDASGIPQWPCSGNGTLFIKLGWTHARFDAGAGEIRDGLVVASVAPALVLPVED